MYSRCWLTIIYSTVYSGADQRKHQSGEFPAQRASNAENISIWWRHHVQPAGLDDLKHEAQPADVACYKRLYLYIRSLDWIKSCTDTEMSLWRSFHHHVVILTTFGAASNEHLIEMAIFLFQCIGTFNTIVMYQLQTLSQHLNEQHVTWSFLRNLDKSGDKSCFFSF